MSMNKLTPEAIKALVVHDHYLNYETLTVCVLTLRSGALVTGESNVIDPANYDPDIGKEMAYKDAFSKIWQLEGYAMKRELAQHTSDCAVHSGPAYPAGECDCGRG